MTSTERPAPDPGNAPPEEWTEPLGVDEQADVRRRLAADREARLARRHGLGES